MLRKRWRDAACEFGHKLSGREAKGIVLGEIEGFDGDRLLFGDNEGRVRAEDAQFFNPEGDRRIVTEANTERAGVAWRCVSLPSAQEANHAPSIR